MGVRRRRYSSGAALIAALCFGAMLPVAPVAMAEDQPSAPAPSATDKDQPGLPAPAAPVEAQPDASTSDSAAKDQPDAPADAADQPHVSDASAMAKDQPDTPATSAWYECAVGEAAHLDDGRSDAATIADALAISCQSEWAAAKAEQCKASVLTPQACGMLADKLDASRRSYDIRVVLAVRARKAEARAAAP